MNLKMKSKMNPGKLLSIWESYWGKLTPKWAEVFLADARIVSILEFDDLMILQAVQQNKKLTQILKVLDENSSIQKIHQKTNKDDFSKTSIGNQVTSATESEIDDIKKWLKDSSWARIDPEEIVTWLAVRTDETTCREKKKYSSEKDAILNVIRIGKQKGEVINQLPYKCNVCRKYHNSHLLSREVIQELFRKYMP